jgi:hypothetical protein
MSEIGNLQPQTPAEELRLDLTRRAQAAYHRARRLRAYILVGSVAASLGQAAWSLAHPAASELPIDTAAIWGVPLLASLFALALTWSCRTYRDQCWDQYVDFVRRAGRGNSLADDNVDAVS